MNLDRGWDWDGTVAGTGNRIEAETEAKLWAGTGVRTGAGIGAGTVDGTGARTGTRYWLG